MSKDYRDTLYMPKTDFPMRGNLGKREVEFQQEWNEMDLYNLVQKKNEKKPYFILHDGPPFSNGDIHMGHAFNKSLKDFIVRYKSMSGFNTPYIPGWDTHGLPIETAIAKKGVKRKEISAVEFRKLCYEYAKGQIENQKSQFQRLGVLGDYANAYHTLDKDFEESQLKLFAKMVDKGLIYKGKKPVYWSPSSESALAEAEIIYKEKTSPSIYVAFPQVDGDLNFVIWTTTPWTMPANLAIAVGETIEYAIVSANGKKYVVAKDLVESVCQAAEFEEYKVLETKKGSELEGLEYTHPLYDRKSPIVIGHHVTVDGGTGLVHTAPGHGEDDFIIGNKYKLDVLCPVDGKGVLTSESGKYEGMFFEKANDVICEDLKEAGALLQVKKIKHSYPHDWRTEKPIMFRATPQWFASIEALKKDMLQAVKDVQWLPEWGEVRLHNMVKDREAWCISRQRVWGVPIPAFYAENGDIILTSETINHVAELFGKEGSQIWWEKDAKDLLPKGFTHPGSPNGVFTKETDIMDGWFDSGTTHHGVLVSRGLPYPADLYIEGSDQYRGWFNSSLSTSVAMTGKSPYKICITHGFINDEKGYKMSKSKGNGIDPVKESNKMGSDIIRLWASSVDYSADVKLGQNMLKQVSESYRKVRNTSKFILGNFEKFDLSKKLSYDKLEEVDKFMFLKLQEYTNNVIDAYDRYQFNEVYKLTNNFISNELSSFYLDFTKDILYIDSANSNARQSVQSVLYDVIYNMMRLLTPIIPHTTHEVYKYIPGVKEKNVYLEDMPSKHTFSKQEEELLAKYNKLLKVRDDVLKALEIAREKQEIGKSLTASVKLSLKDEYKEVANLACSLSQVFIVSKLELVETNNGYEGTTSFVEVAKAEGHTCPRCWVVVDDLKDTGVCDRCDKHELHTA